MGVDALGLFGWRAILTAPTAHNTRNAHRANGYGKSQDGLGKPGRTSSSHAVVSNRPETVPRCGYGFVLPGSEPSPSKLGVLGSILFPPNALD